MPKHSVARERRTEIIDATIRVLSRDGLAQTTTRKIAGEAGVNQATLRYYFESKDDLLFAVLQEMMRRGKDIAHRAGRLDGGLRQAIAASITAFWTHVEAAPELEVMQYELTLYALRHPESAWLARQQYDGYRAVTETLLQNAFAAAHEPCAVPFADLARFVVGAVDGMILQFIADRDKARARRDLAHVVDAVIALAASAAPMATSGA